MTKTEKEKLLKDRFHEAVDEAKTNGIDICKAYTPQMIQALVEMNNYTICSECKNKCSEYYANGISDKSYYEWCRKSEKCEANKENETRKLDHIPFDKMFIVDGNEQLCQATGNSLREVIR